MKGLTKQTEAKDTTHHTLNAVGERVHCDGEDVWVCDVDERVSVEEFRAALDAIDAGAERVEFSDDVGYIEKDCRDTILGRLSAVLYIGGRRRATNIECQIHSDLRELLDAACE